MVSFFNKHKRIILTITVGVFVIGVFFGMGAVIGSITFANAVAKVDGRRIPYDRYQMQVRVAYDNIVKNQNVGEAGDMIEKMVKQEVFKDMIVQEILYQQARKLNIGVSNFEVAVEIENTPMFFNEKRFDPRLYVQSIWTNYRMTPKEYEQWRKEERTAMKFKQFLYSEIKITPDDIKFYSDILGPKIKEVAKDKLELKIKQEKFLDVANYFLRQLTGKIEIKDYRNKFEPPSKS